MYTVIHKSFPWGPREGLQTFKQAHVLIIADFDPPASAASVVWLSLLTTGTWEQVVGHSLSLGVMAPPHEKHKVPFQIYGQYFFDHISLWTSYSTSHSTEWQNYCGLVVPTSFGAERVNCFLIHTSLINNNHSKPSLLVLHSLNCQEIAKSFLFNPLLFIVCICL